MQGPPPGGWQTPFRERGMTEVQTTSLERQLAELRLLHEGVLATVGEAVLIGELDGTVTACNRAAIELYGWPEAELRGRNIFQVALADAARDESDAILDRVCRGDGWWGESRAWRRDGSVFPTEVAITPVRDRDGYVAALVVAASDLSARHDLEEQFRHAQKMEALGLIASGVAHDFNNLLTAIRGYADLALRELAADHPVRDDLRQIAQASQRAAALTTQLLAFARRQTPDPALLDLNAVLADLLRLIERVIGEDVELVVTRAADLWPVRGDRIHVEQVLLNLVVNARDALPRGGKVAIGTANATLDAPLERFGLRADSGDYVALTVRDNGLGMDPETRARLFEPFYTTKPHGRGTGLGLATVYGIVRQAGGAIEVKSEPNAGSCFTIYLPRALDARRPRASGGASSALRGGHDTVLLVEDDEQVRPIAERVLRRLGYAVLSARGAEEAVRLSHDHAGPIDLVLTDIALPRSSGVELAGRLASQRPNVQILFMSGYADAAAPRHEPLPRGSRFLAKPFTPEKLARSIRDALDAIGDDPE
jgi:PAS domain S-box-containing protein